MDCAGAANGHATAAPTPAMKSRRLIRSPRFVGAQTEDRPPRPRAIRLMSSSARPSTPLAIMQLIDESRTGPSKSKGKVLCGLPLLFLLFSVEPAAFGKLENHSLIGGSRFTANSVFCRKTPAKKNTG
jgi:hypothetical protein